MRCSSSSVGRPGFVTWKLGKDILLTEWASGSPGYSIRRVLGDMSLDDLRTLLKPELAGILTLRDSGLEESEALASAVLKLRGGQSLLHDALTRSTLLRYLPLPKAQELLGRLGVQLVDRPYRALDERFREPSSEDLTLLLRFFGVSEESASGRDSPRGHGTSRICPHFGLFEHQRITLRAVIKALTEDRTLLLHMPTGSGKTRTAMHYVARQLRARDEGLVFWLSEQPEVLEQAAEAFERAWSSLGDRPLDVFRLYGAGDIVPEQLESGLVLGGFQKLHSVYRSDQNLLLRLGDRTDLVVVDEAHQAVAPTYNSVIRALARKRPETRLLGLTATPGRTWADVEEDFRLSEFFEGRKVTLQTGDGRNPIRFLIEEEYLADPTFRHIELSDRSAGDHLGGLNNGELVGEIQEMLARHHRLIVFASSVPHAELLTAVLGYENVDCGLVTADTPSNKRDYLYRRFRRDTGEPMVLVNYGVLTTGFDAPAASGAIIARATRSLVLFSQMVGRVLRGPKAGGTATAEIVTTVDTRLPGFGSVREAFMNWEDVWNE